MRISIRTLVLGMLLVLGTFVNDAAAKKGGGGGKPGGDTEPPANPEIACIQPGSRSYDLVVMNADGSNVTVLVANAGDGLMAPSWAPDGSEVVFNGTLDGVPGVYAVDLALLTVATITTGAAWSPACCPVQDSGGNYRIAYHATGLGPNAQRMDLFVVNRDGTGGQNLTETDDVAERYPTWSSEGDRIALVAADFTAGRSDVLVYDVGADGTGGIEVTAPVNVTNVSGSLLQAATNFSGCDWARSAGSSDLVLSAEKGGQDLWVLDVDAPATAWNATNTATGAEIEPSWSPADQQVVFRRVGKGKTGSGIFVFTPGFSALTSVGNKAMRAADWKR